MKSWRASSDALDSQCRCGSPDGYTTGNSNVGIGVNALHSNTTGDNNTAIGDAALYRLATGNRNTAFGAFALTRLTLGDDNVAVGPGAGEHLTSGSNNAYFANEGSVDPESGTVRSGSSFAHTRLFLAGVLSSPISGSQVLINQSGQVGILASSRRAKLDIRNMGTASAGLAKLRPVTFRYRPEHDDGARLLQYGLIAEEVAKVYPELVVTDPQGHSASVRYHLLPVMLLNEVQRQQRQLEAQAARLARQDERLRDQAALLAAQGRAIEALSARLRALGGRESRAAGRSAESALRDEGLGHGIR